MSIITKDPFMMRRAGLMFLLLGPGCLFAAWAYRDEGARGFIFIGLFGLAGVLVGLACLRRAKVLARNSSGG